MENERLTHELFDKAEISMLYLENEAKLCHVKRAPKKSKPILGKISNRL